MRRSRLTRSQFLTPSKQQASLRHRKRALPVGDPAHLPRSLHDSDAIYFPPNGSFKLVELSPNVQMVQGAAPTT